MTAIIKPAFITPPACNSIALSEASLAIIPKRKTAIHVTGRATLRLQPTIKLVIETEFSDITPEIFSFIVGDKADEIRIQFGPTGLQTDAVVINKHLNVSASGSRVAIELLPNPQRLVFRNGNTSRMSKCIFHIVNFPTFLCSGSESTNLCLQSSPTEKRLLGRVVLNEQKWQIEIQETLGTAKLIKHIRNFGGHGITHVGQLTRSNGKTFTATEAGRIINDLYLFLSFSRGAWTPPILCVGYDSGDNKVYEDWSIRLGTPWESRTSWFDPNHGEHLASFYPHFVHLLRDSKLGNATANALYWYLRSNRGGDGAGIDSGIILSHAALERLSTAVLEWKAIAPAKKEKAAEQLRKTLISLNIPRVIPSELKSLKRGQRKMAWKDGPEAISKVRNELVHPSRRLSIKLGKVIPETWRLAQWYIELLVLRLAGYNGSYSNRLTARWVGEISKPPWSKHRTN